MARIAIFIGIQNTGAMSGWVDTARALAYNALMAQGGFLSTDGNSLDVQFCIFGIHRTIRTFKGITRQAELDVALTALSDVDGNDGQATSDDFAEPAEAFFLDTLGEPYDRRVCLLIRVALDRVYGLPFFSDIVDPSSGDFSHANETAVECVVATTAAWSSDLAGAHFDNTPANAPPFVHGPGLFDGAGYLAAALAPLPQSATIGLRHSWERSYVQEIEFRTEIIQSRRGYEQRIAQRARPRIKFQSTHLATPALFARTMQRLAENEGREMVAPYEREPVRLTLDADEGDAVVYPDALPRWGVPGLPILFGTPDGGLLLAQMARVDTDAVGPSANRIYLTQGLDQALPAGTKAWFGCKGRLSDVPRFSAMTSSVGEAEIEFAVAPDAFPHPDYGSAQDTYRGDEVLTLRPNWIRNPEITFEQDRFDLDTSRGIPDYLIRRPYTTRTTRAEFLLDTPARQEQFLGLFYRCRGKQRRFFFPTATAEATLARDIAAADTTVVVRGRDMHEQFVSSTTYRHLRIVFRDGTSFSARVELVTPYGASDSLLTLDAPIPDAHVADDVLNINWLVPTRFASDRLTVEWLTDTVARVDATFVSLEEDK